MCSSTSARGPCFISPARMPSLCISATSLTCKRCSALMWVCWRRALSETITAACGQTLLQHNNVHLSEYCISHCIRLDRAQ